MYPLKIKFDSEWKFNLLLRYSFSQFVGFIIIPFINLPLSRCANILIKKILLRSQYVPHKIGEGWQSFQSC